MENNERFIELSISSKVQSTHYLKYIKFAGKLIVRSIIEETSVQVHFAVYLLIYAFQISLVLKEIEYVCNIFNFSLLNIPENLVDNLDIYFEVIYDYYGKFQTD
jgi:diacylglycerol kinase